MVFTATAAPPTTLMSLQNEPNESIEMEELTELTRINAIWKAVEAPRTRFELDGSKFYLPEGPLSKDSFQIVLSKGELGLVDNTGLRLLDAECKIKTKKADKGVSLACGRWIVDYHPRQAALKCVIGHGTAAEQCMIRRLQSECQRAEARVAKSMSILLWYHVQLHGGVRVLLLTDVITSLERTAAALKGFANVAGRFVETMLKRYQGGGREEKMPIPFKKAIELLGLAQWYRVHRAINGVQCLEKAFQRLATEGPPRNETRKAKASTRALGFIRQNLLEMLGWRSDSDKFGGSQRGVLSEALLSLMVLGETDWESFEAEQVRQAMGVRSSGVFVVKDREFCAWTFAKVLRFLSHRSLAFDDLEEARKPWPGPDHFEGHIHRAHLAMMKALPWVKAFDRPDHVLLRLTPSP